MKIRRQFLLTCEVGVPESLVGTSRTWHLCRDRDQRPGRWGGGHECQGCPGVPGDLPTGPLPGVEGNEFRIRERPDWGGGASTGTTQP